ncbi:hypothetical protein KAI04_03525 [Candidatus Pacearchaeota archaeon]|nr:hypothetical protein [Candidatus Pacearchaeota archaeon]
MVNKNNEESVSDNFKEARGFVKKWYDLNLTLIEQVELKKIVEHTTNIYINDKKEYGKKYSKWQIRPSLEAMYIFMNKNYGTQITDYGSLYEINYKRNQDMNEKGYDSFPEFFKKMQEEMHFP